MKLFAATFLLCSTLVLAQTPTKDAKKPGAPPAKVDTKAAKDEKQSKPEVGGAFISNKKTKKYHKPDCKAVTQMKPENKVSYATKAEAEKAGAKPCKTCKP